MEIPLHVPFAAGAKDLRFAGVRKVNGQWLALLREGRVIMVMPMDNVSAGRGAGMKVGDPIRVKDGIVRGRGLGR